MNRLPKNRIGYHPNKEYTHVIRWGRDTAAGITQEEKYGHRVTVGRAYRLLGSADEGFYVMGNDGKRFYVTCESHWWSWVGKESEECEDVTFTTHNFYNNTHNQEETTTMAMLKIEKPTIINGTRVTVLSAETLLAHIQDETDNIARLEALKIESKAIEKIKARHEANIVVLLEVLETRVDTA